MLRGKVCFVTGAARGKGNGRSIALKLARKGAHVATGDILYDEAQGVAEEIRAIGSKSLAVKMDLSDYDQVTEGFEKIRKGLGAVDILVNNAAIMTNMATISSMKKEAWEKEISVNLSGAFYCVKQVFDDMAEKKWGRIINITSVAGTMRPCSAERMRIRIVAGNCCSRFSFLRVRNTTPSYRSQAGIRPGAATLRAEQLMISRCLHCLSSFCRIAIPITQDPPLYERAG